MTTPVGEPHYFIRRSYRDLAEGALPDRHVLDRATRDHPVMIQAWAPVIPNVCAFNSTGLARLGLGPETPDRVQNVWIEKDSGGEPTGILRGLGHELLHRRRVHERAPAPAAAPPARRRPAGDARRDARLQRARRHDRLRGARDGRAAHRGVPGAPPRRRAHRPRPRDARGRELRPPVGPVARRWPSSSERLEQAAALVDGGRRPLPRERRHRVARRSVLAGLHAHARALPRPVRRADARRLVRLARRRRSARCASAPRAASA